MIELSFETLGIDDAHELAKIFAQSGEQEIIVRATSLSLEAQNALLKTLETPAVGLKLKLCHPAPDSLLPTLRSRAGTEHFQLLTLEGGKEDNPIFFLENLEKKYYKDGVAKRGAELRKILEAKEKILSGVTPKLVLEHLEAML